MPSIVQIIVTQMIAPTPETLQETGALLSQGGTTLSSGSSALLTQLSDLTSILSAAKTLSGLVWSGSVVTGTTAAPHGWTVSDVVPATIAGVTPSGYNGNFNITITGASTFTYPLASNPGSETIPGTVILASESEILAMATTYFAQGTGHAVYVLELGEGTVAEGVATLSAYLIANPNSSYTPGASGFYYAYLVPREWDVNSNFLALVASYESTTARTYFFVTTTTGTYSTYTPLMKCIFPLIEAPGVANPEFSCASAFWEWLHYQPSTTNKVTPFAFSFVFGVTPYPVKGNNALLTTLKNANINVIGTGAEGGISDAIILWGTSLDGNDMTYWYSVDWVQINGDLQVSNAVINGSNDPINPLYYDQNGVNRLETRLASVMSQAVTYGLANGTVKQFGLDGPDLVSNLNDGSFTGLVAINAVPFIPYSAENPGDYKIGKYGGLAVVYVPARGFTQIIININVSTFIAA